MTVDTVSVKKRIPYPEYAEFRSEGLTTLPTHWRTSRLKYVTAMNSEVLREDTDPDYEIEYLDIGNVDSLGRINELQAMRFADAPSRARRVVRHGDVVLSTVRTYLRAIAEIKDPPPNLIASTGFAVLRPLPDVHPRFLSLLVQSNEFVDIVVNHSEGVGYPAINPTELGSLRLWLPPLGEQRAIAAFLDRETARIDALIAKKERLITLLEEKCQATITHAVTRGLDPNVEMKDSGFEWIGTIPAQWELQRVSSFSRIVRGASPRPAGDPRYFYGNHTPWITVAEVTKDDSKYLDATEECLTEEGRDLSRLLESGTFILTNSGATLGVPKILRISGCINDGSVAFLNIAPNVLKDFLYYYFTSQTSDVRIRVNQGMGQPNLNTGLVARMPVPMPPLEEQVRIVQELDRMVDLSRNLVRLIQVGIDRLREYRTALISAAVTGQIDVRGEVNLDD